MKNWILIFIAAFTFLSITDASRIINDPPELKEVYNADIIIYGGTSAAIIAAVEVVKSGKTVLIVSPEQHLGGLTSGGLGFTDTGNKAVIGGLSREFYHRVWLHYKDAAAWNWQNQSDFDLSSALILTRRGTTACAGGLTWSADMRLRESSAYRLLQSQAIQLLGNIQCPVLAILASDGLEMMQQARQQYQSCYQQLEWVEIRGGHHCHMTQPEQTANAIRQFLLS